MLCGTSSSYVYFLPINIPEICYSYIGVMLDESVDDNGSIEDLFVI